MKDNFSSPAMASWGMNENKVFSNQWSGESLDETQKYYGVYQEGIYVGYRYYETRYADMVKVTNTGDTYSGKETVQVYLQKPYTEYYQQYGTETAAVELVGVGKTDILAPGESETLTISVEKENFAVYDTYGEETYILDEGDYYLTAAKDSHAAVNNILSAKGKTEEDGMDALPEYGVASGMTLIQMRGKSYDDEDWEKLLDQMTFEEMNQLLTTCVCNTPSVASIAKPWKYAAAPDRGNAHAVMSSFNRVGCVWSSVHENMISQILREKIGFDGYCTPYSLRSLQLQRSYEWHICQYGDGAYLYLD